ncbi:CRISPR-associated endonuclease Cas2 [Paenibacillus sp. JCM 10914]|uniref:CRISPR-associated endonuclease Cas2 n=1 Tax=Paenibacillus sp. JCM 10914 TaxID=1236974 RepID=UPI0003CC3750|nr:CRISPR-associated endonuclease Cas2 [Paenibacillus sp. JCM 10914]GAE10008.1 CRISPR-associated protein Cas2 [Paenibacillus sp. JCM 10914]
MLVVITYDVSTLSSEGQRRLRQISKICQDYGQRVQHSVFECIVDATEYTVLKRKLIDTMDKEEDSLRFYQIGNNYKNKVEHIGIKKSLDMEGLLIL